MATKQMMAAAVLAGAWLAAQVAGAGMASAQTATNMAALKGLAPVSELGKTPAGQSALSANYVLTGRIQTGAERLPTLLPLAQQRAQALKDAFITDGNLAQLADGLGTSLGSAYLARAHYLDAKRFTSISPAVAELIAYATGTTSADAGSGKFFFANGTTDGKAPVSADAADIYKSGGGVPDIFGRSYHLPAGSPNGDPFGNSRPFQTETHRFTYTARDYFNALLDNDTYNSGPTMDLTGSPSYPSGHTTYGYTGAVLLAVLVPERYSQMVVRGAEYGNDRIIVGAHYIMDVLGGRTLALHDMAHLLANDPAYVGRTVKGATVTDFRAAVTKARADLVAVLEAACGAKTADCARADTDRLSDAGSNGAFYAATQTYDLPVVYPAQANSIEDVGKLAPEAGYLLTVAFPSLSLDQANAILTETEGPGGGFLDNGSGFGVYSRLNLYSASLRAAAMTAGK